MIILYDSDKACKQNNKYPMIDKNGPRHSPRAEQPKKRFFGANSTSGHLRQSKRTIYFSSEALTIRRRI